jgi:VWFA-related protein
MARVVVQAPDAGLMRTRDVPLRGILLISRPAGGILVRMRTHLPQPGGAVAVALLLLTAPAMPAAQGPERATPLLTVDFVAVARDGSPIQDLRPEEITIRIANRGRPVRSLQIVGTADPAGAASPEPPPPPFGSNARYGAGRTVVLAVDEDSFRPGREQPLREAVDLLVDRLQPDDRVALVTMPYGGLKVPFTTEHPRLRGALSHLVGQAAAGETASELACRTRETLTALGSFLGTLGVREGPVTLVFVTAALAAPRHDAPAMLAPGICELRAELFEQVALAAGAARAHVYVVQPDAALERSSGGLRRENIAGVGYSGSENPFEGIEHLAGVTGGKILQLTGTPETALGRVLRETSVRYVAGIAPERTDRTGRAQQLDVRVSRPGVEVRAARHVVFMPPEPSLARTADPSPRDMLAVSTVFRDLPLRAAAFTPVDDDPQQMRVVTMTEPAEAGVELAALMAALFDADGRAIANWVATGEEIAQRPVVGAMRVPAGGYRLRVAAIDAAGRAGTVDYEVAPDVTSSGPLKISSLVLGLSREGAFVPRLQFTTEPVAIGYVEMAGAAAGTQVAATLELARTVNGPALVEMPLAIEPAGGNRYTARGAVPIGTLPPGDYVVRAIIGVEGHPATRVVRTLRKAALQ